MKTLIKITKKYRINSDVLHIIVDSNISEDYLKELVEDVCELHPGGRANGYSYDWEEVSDIDYIKQYVNRESTRILEEYQFKAENLLQLLK
jgi:hypothetical protein